MGRLQFSRFVQLILAQIGPKRNKQVSLAMLLNSYDLPGSGWKSRPPITVRPFVVGGHDAVAKRARKNGCVAAWKTFDNLQSSRRVKIQVGPLASIDDAKLRIASFRDKMLAGVEANDRAVEVPLGPAFESSPRLDHIEGFAYSFNRGKGRVQSFLIIAGRVDEIAYSVACSSDDDDWTWDDVFAIALLQREKIVKVRESSAS